MPDNRLRIGMRFIRQGREYVIEGRLGNGELKIRDTVSDLCSTQPVNELLDELFAGKLELVGEANYRLNLKNKLSRTRITDISQLKDDDPLKLEIVRRFHYVKEVITSMPLARTAKNLSPIIQRVAQKINDPCPPSWTTLNRWFRTFELARRDIRALASSYKARGNRKQKISGKVPAELTEQDYEKAEAVAAIVDRVIRTKYLTRERLSVQSVYEMIVDRIDEENRYREAHDQLPFPHISSLYKIISRLDRYEVDSKRYSKKYADEKHRAHKQGPRPTRPLQRVECDHTKIDLMVIDDKTRWPLGRPWLTAIIDVYTKMILGIYLSFHRPGALSVMQCLLHAIRPKSYVKRVYREVKNDWPTYGIPEEIWVDNASEFYSSHFKDACLQLGIEPNHSPVGCAWFRATVERWFGTLNKHLLHELPGTTFSNIFQKMEYDPQKHAVISLEVLLKIIHIWIIDYYQKRFHRGIQDIPYRRWTEGVLDSPPNLPPCLSELEVLLGFIVHRRVSSSGIELFSLYYNLNELSLLRKGLKENEKVMIKYDPTDISLIYVWDKHNGRFLQVPALNQEYTRGLTLWQHHIIRRYARHCVKDHVDIIALCQAKALIQKIVESERLIRKRIGGKQKIAHYLNIGQPNYEKDASLPIADGLESSLLPAHGDTSHYLFPGESGLGEVSKSKQEHSTPVEEAGWSDDYDLPVEGEENDGNG